MTKKTLNFPIFLGIAIAVGIFIGSNLNFKNKSVLFSNNNNEAKIKRLINYIQYDYVDNVDTDSLLDDAIRNMLVKLDPHSVYIPKEELQQSTENMQGKFVGIGVSFVIHNDSVAVASIIKGGPSERAGLLAGDRILIADKDTLYGKYLENKANIAEGSSNFVRSRKMSNAVIKTLKGKPKTIVNALVYRKKTNEVLEIPIKRGDVSLKSVDGYYMINQTLGYINIDRFARTTYKEFKVALDSLISKGMTSLVLDLRGNPGGFMDIANSIIDEFLEDGKLIVFTKGKNSDIDKSFATAKGDFEKGDIYVLIDGNSASASEIVAGALQDNDKGTIVGRRSFGKGLVQQEMDLGDGSAIRLTTSRYYTPTGRSIQKPYSKTNSKKYQTEYLERIYNGELISRDSIKVNDSLKFKTPKGKIVYGGGGIIPDVFVSIDTTSSFSNKVFRNLNSFTFEYIDNHRAEMDTWKLNSFVRNFDKDDKILNKYINELDVNFPLTVEVRKKLKMYLNAFFARNLFEDVGYFMIIEKEDPMILKVLELEQEKQ